VGKIVSRQVLQLGHDAVAQIASCVAAGAPLLQCQLLASRFYEALKDELNGARNDQARRGVLAAAVNQCRRAAAADVGPPLMLVEVRAAVDILETAQGAGTIDHSSMRSFLRVIEGGLAR
jgi:hypothetical protein